MRRGDISGFFIVPPGALAATEITRLNPSVPACSKDGVTDADAERNAALLHPRSNGASYFFSSIEAEKISRLGLF